MFNNQDSTILLLNIILIDYIYINYHACMIVLISNFYYHYRQSSSDVFLHEYICIYTFGKNAGDVGEDNRSL